MKQSFLFPALLAFVFISCGSKPAPADGNNKPVTIAAKPMPVTGHPDNPYYSHTDFTPLNLPDSVWKRILPEEVYEVARNKETERPYTGKYYDFDARGTYYCAACGNPLFRSDSKFVSSCGWPSFFQVMRKNSVVYLQDDAFGMSRTEVECGRCGAHLGHLFDDGPPPTGQRYCMNSIVLDFVPDKEK